MVGYAQEQGLPLGYVDRLTELVRWSYKQMKPFREVRQEIERECAGMHYGEDGATPDRVPVNFMQMYLQIYMRLLLPQRPTAIARPKRAGLEWPARAFQSWCNDETEAIGLQQTLERVLRGALTGIGMARIGVCYPDEHGLYEEWDRRPTLPFIDAIDLEDLVLDMKVKVWEQMSFVGHRFGAPLYLVRQNQLYDEEARLQLKGQRNRATNPGGDSKINTLSTGSGDAPEDLDEMVELWELYLPRRRQLVTLASDGDDSMSFHTLRVADWTGPPSGPYLPLVFEEMPGNMMPAAPAASMLDLHQLANRVFNKLSRQVDRQKMIVIYNGSAADDADRVDKTPDGKSCRVDNVDKFKEIRYGGADPASAQLFLALKDMISYFGGSLDVISGRGAQSPTATQDQQILQTAGVQVAAMQTRLQLFARQVLRQLGWYWWQDPFRTYHVNMPLPGMPSISADYEMGPEERQVRFEDLGIDVDAYSLLPKSPDQVAQQLMMFMTQQVLPLGQQLMMEGKSVSVSRYFDIMAQLLHMPELREILQEMAPQQMMEQQPMMEEQGMPAETTRNYVRRSVGADQQTQDEAMRAMAQSQPYEGGAGRLEMPA